MKTIQFIKENKWLLLILALATFLRFYKLDFQSLWLDEILSMNDSNPNLTWKEFYNGIMFWEFIPHFFFAQLRIFFELFGYTSFSARLFSAIYGILGVYAIYILVKEIFNKKAALIASLILSVNIFHISYSQEVRPYGMLLLFTILAFYRLSIYLKNATIKNSILLGVFSGLIIHSHFFGFITVFSLYLIVLVFLINCPKVDRLSFFKNSFVSGIVFIIVILPALDPMVRVSEIKSFWLQKPGNEAFTEMFKEFFGNSEWLLFLINFLIIFYFLILFKIKNKKNDYLEIKNDKHLFSFIILFVWLIISLLIPLLRSYLDVPMILSRYFINILPIFIIIIVIAIMNIKNKIIQYSIISYFVILSLIDVFVIKNHYNTVSKSQFRELTNEIKKRNSKNDKVVAYWSWLFPYFFQDSPKVFIVANTIEDYIIHLKKGEVKLESFWYADANSRPFNLSNEDQKYLNEYFILKEQLNYYDAWANFYELKNEFIKEYSINDFNLFLFKTPNLDENKNIILFENSSISSEEFFVEKGTYEIYFKGISLPSIPIKNENAHIVLKLNNKVIANFYLSEKPEKAENKFSFTQESDEKVEIQIIYDNDLFYDGKDRNAIINNISIKKK